MRWLHGADGPGPDYCQLAGCAPEGCNDCPRPGVLPANRNAVALFMRTATQWRLGPNGPQGLDYTALHSTAQWLGLAVTDDLLQQIQVLEAETLKIAGQKQITHGH